MADHTYTILLPHGAGFVISGNLTEVNGQLTVTREGEVVCRVIVFLGWVQHDEQERKPARILQLVPNPLGPSPAAPA